MRNYEIKGFKVCICIFFGIIFLFYGCAIAYEPPVGIPMPSFGIDQTNNMYQGKLFDYDQNGIPEALYKDAGNGPYTHFVDNTGSCTDTGNDYGTEANPRCTIPKILPKGSVVEVHGGPYTLNIRSNGTESQPVFVRGIGAENMPTITNASPISDSTYLIMEYLKFSATGIEIRQVSHHIALRNSEVNNFPMPV